MFCFVTYYVGVSFRLTATHFQIEIKMGPPLETLYSSIARKWQFPIFIKRVSTAKKKIL